VFTGCGHAGVVNTARNGLTLGRGAPLYGIMGGYHLADAEPPKLEATVADIKALKPGILLPGHCTGWRAKFVMEKEMPGTLAPSTVGTKFTFV
jgi:7,8-dihydropterin-6-yl-methyl-4-(beta-D-ribofuranosyl)aminobenzene 5'-phosphate synthase